MLRWIGAALVLSGSGSFGLSKTLQYYRQVRLLRDFVAAVEVLKCELNYTMLPIASLFRVTSERVGGTCGRYFASLSDALQAGTPRRRATERAVAQTRGLCLPKDALMALMELCESLGRYDVDGENRMLQLCGQRMKSALERTEAEKKPLARSYASLGFCTGIALVILMV